MITYGAIHQRIRYKYGKPKLCEKCGVTGGRLEWSNKNHKYLLIRSEWWQLCSKCHRQYDREKFGAKPAWNKGDTGRKPWHDTSGLKPAWNRGIKTKEEIRCGHCRKKFYPPKITSSFCSKSCAMYKRDAHLP